jgi:hypothetical protein
MAEYTYAYPGEDRPRKPSKIRAELQVEKRNGDGSKVEYTKPIKRKGRGRAEGKGVVVTKTDDSMPMQDAMQDMPIGRGRRRRRMR